MRRLASLTSETSARIRSHIGKVTAAMQQALAQAAPVTLEDMLRLIDTHLQGLP